MVSGPSVRWLDDEQQRHWRAYLGGSTALIERLDRDLREQHNLSMSEYEVLVRLSESAGRTMRMAELAEAAALSRSRLTHTIERLEKSGFVQRHSCSQDRRGIEASLTATGLDALRTAAHTHVNGVQDYLVAQLSAEELAVVGTVMERIVESLGGKRF